MRSKQSTPNDKHCILLASPSRKLESFCCTPSMIPCFRKVLSNLVCIISNWLWCKALILLRLRKESNCQPMFFNILLVDKSACLKLNIYLVYNHSTHIWDSPRARKYPTPWAESAQRFVCHSQRTLWPPSVRAHMAAVSYTSDALRRQSIVVELLSIPWLSFYVLFLLNVTSIYWNLTSQTSSLDKNKETVSMGGTH